MAEIDKTRVSLTLHGETLEPDEITRALGCAPTRARRKGDTRASGFVYKDGMWSISLDEEAPGDLEQKANRIIDGLTEDTAIWADLNARFSARVFCGLFMQGSNEGFGLSSETLHRLSRRGLRIEFDIYDGADDEHRE